MMQWFLPSPLGTSVPLSLSYFADAYWAEEIYMRLHICLEEHTNLVESTENNMYLPLKLNPDCFWRLPKKVEVQESIFESYLLLTFTTHNLL
jgi:hypothetical protein